MAESIFNNLKLAEERLDSCQAQILDLITQVNMLKELEFPLLRTVARLRDAQEKEDQEDKASDNQI